jgi:putative transcriptional regulator
MASYRDRRIDEGESFLEGKLLIAMPGMGDDRFVQTVIYICAHSAKGAMGLVINRPIPGLSFSDMMKQLEIGTDPAIEFPVLYGGPVETGRGFVLHSVDYEGDDATLMVSDGIALTATLDILRAIASGGGPQRSMLALGYAGWGPGQLDAEIQANGWLNVAADDDIVFGRSLGDKWERALAKLGIHPLTLSGEAGHA